MKKVVNIHLEKKNEKKKDVSKERFFPPVYKNISHQSVLVNKLYLDESITEKKNTDTIIV